MKTAWHLCSISFFLSVLWVAPLSNGRNAHTRVYQVFDRKECCALSLSLLSQRYCAIGTTGFVTGCACTRCERSLVSHLMHTYILVVVVVLFLFFFFASIGVTIPTIWSSFMVAAMVCCWQKFVFVHFVLQYILVCAWHVIPRMIFCS